MLRDWNHNEHKYFFWSFPDKIIFQYTLSLIPLQLCVNLYPSIRKFFLCSSSNPLLSQCCSIFFEYVLCQTISPHNTVMSVIDIIPWCFHFFYSSFPFFFGFSISNVWLYDLFKCDFNQIRKWQNDFNISGSFFHWCCFPIWFDLSFVVLDKEVV